MLVLMGAALVAFVTELFPIEVTALGVLAILLATGILEPAEALAGFSSTAVVAIAGLFVLSHALTKTGILETIADRIGDRAVGRPGPMMLLLLVAVAFGSGALNNTAVVAISIPLVMKLCRRLDLSPSRVLMPLSFASILGGTLTLIGTSTNLLISSLMDEAGVAPIGVFELSVLGGVLLVAGLAYVTVAAGRLLPERAASGALTQRYLGEGFLTELVVTEGSDLAGATLRHERIRERYGVRVLKVLRGAEESHLEDLATLPLRPGDHLLVKGELEDILRLRRDRGLQLIPDARPGDRQLARGGEVLVEAWIAPGSQMAGRTLKDLDFHHHHGAFVLAVRRIGATLRERVGDVVLRAADALLILSPPDRLERLEESGDLRVLSEHEVHLRRQRLWWLVLLLLPAVILTAALGWIDIGAVALIGAVVLLLARVMTPEEAYRTMNWQVLIMIAAFVPVGHAFQVTGTADVLAHGLLAASAWAPADLAPFVILAMLYLLTSFLTQIASNSAAAVVVAPIALSLGPSLGVDSRPFVITVCFAASAAFVTPMGYQTNLMVYAAGEYRFADYARFGAPLSLLLWVLTVLLVPFLWSFTP